MAGQSQNSDDEPITGINVTPLVDICLVLLIIFMVATPMIMKPSINVNLPKASSSDQSTPGELSITISKTGEIFANGKKVSDVDLKNMAQGMAISRPDLQAMISADKDTSHGSVIGVIDLIKSVGVKKFAISIEKK